MAAYETGALLEAIADPTRRTIFERLGVAPRSVAELAADLPVSRPAVSQHLEVLKDAGQLQVHAQGTRRIYSVDPDALAALRGYFESFWRKRLSDFASTLEVDQEKP